MLIGDCHCGIAGKRRPSGKHFIQHATCGIQVGTHVDAFAARLLGRQILRGADHALRLRHRGCGIVERAGDAEVHDLDHALLGNHDVAGLDVTVDDAHAVRILERVEHTHHHLFGVALAQSAVHFENVAQGLALDILHHQIRQMLGLAGFGGDDFLTRIVDVHDVGIVHLRHGMGFATETLKEDLVVGEVGAHDLDRDGTSKTRIECHVHFGHAATADQLAELVTFTSQRGRHVDVHPCSFPSVLKKI